ncbi:hypothetical protein GF357_04600 [Candidatus Dojkabacteria bacterium]|nr:hypothetical protein [Candidatus Dojkabacteria bacterium]
MGYQYYSVFPEGLTNTIKEIIIKNNIAKKFLKEGSSFIVYSSCTSPNMIAKARFFETTFLLASYFEQNYKIKDQIDWFRKNIRKIVELSGDAANKTSSFRIVESRSIRDGEKYNDQIRSLEHLLSKKIRIDRGHPDYEIRLIEKEDHGFIGIRVTKPPEHIDTFQEGSLRKEIAYVLNYLSNPKGNDVFIDPFCGGGIIPLLRSEMAPYRTIIASDIDTSSLKSKISKLKMQKNSFIIKTSDLQNLEFDDKTLVNKIVTDPPWGLVQKIPNLETFYEQMFQKFIDISASQTTVVLLSSQEDAIQKALERFRSIMQLTQKIELKVSGRKAYIFILRRIG